MPVFHLRPPSDQAVRKFLDQQRDAPFSYSEVGATASKLPGGYNIDRHITQLGRGEATWVRAVQAIKSWTMFDIGWLRLCWPSAPISAGVSVAVLVHHFGFYSMNASRIVYVVHDPGNIERFGFAYGTLCAHAERGEERFTVEWNHTDDSVSYQILAFSLPNHWAVRLANSTSRRLQARFAESSKAAMLRACAHGSKTGMTKPA